MIYQGSKKMPDLCQRRSRLSYITAINLLMKIGINPRQIEILAVGEYQNYRGQVHAQTPAPGTELNSESEIILEVGYPSPVDWMPYQFFYGLAGSYSSTGAWEDSARHLMAPFDTAAVLYDAIAHYEDMKYQLAFVDRQQLQRFTALFDFIPDGIKLSLEELLRWAILLPSFHNWSGNAEKMADVLSGFFGYNFRIIENCQGAFEIPEKLQYRLGRDRRRVGRDAILGKSFKDFDSTYEVILSGIESDRIIDFLPGKNKRKKLDWMLGVCMPGNLQYRLKFKVRDRQAILGQSDKGAHIGYSSYLGRPVRRGIRVIND